MIFPFSPNINWKLDEKNVISGLHWRDKKKLFKNDIVNIICNGSSFESYLSLSFISFLKEKNINTNWIGKEIETIKLFDNNINIKELNFNLSDYPTPYFIHNNEPYFNLDFNSERKYSIYGKFIGLNLNTKLHNLINNMYVKWSADYLPSIKLEINDKIKLWAKANKINLNKQYFIIFPDKINNNSEDYFNWTLQEFKSFNQMMSMKDIQVIVMADKIGSYSSLIPTLKFSMYDSLALMSKAACVIARDIDILCFAAVFCSGSVIATRKLNYNSFYRRASLLGVSDKVLELKAVTPYAVFSKYFSKLA